ncbi:DUF2157 domain-containing protein [Phycicoccus endophyticus]|uniref:DUF2157 domain-containing protein n=1 Tax=Phycicoccus endophyticus TaxID=1690220 RepID=A0A7G9R2Y1_9MICO|nr:DUF2157 domain-containing protein [Phycicoccus endophyticus]NHI20247.1 DUF2157 domain-containing protein [Phycicoccus endophyticus]QNN49956.1 DUF2157 domain-containing protein [Phycicoccus endophyticus]
MSPRQLAWLEEQLGEWAADGLLDEQAVAAVRARYQVHRRVTLTGTVLTLGSLFVGVGLLWAVVANIEAMSHLVRLVLVLSLWLGLLATAELLAHRRARAGDLASPAVGALRLLAAAALGAVVFQGALAAEVATGTPGLLGLWALGALGYAYAVAALGPTVLGVVLGAGWLLWEVGERADDVLAVTTAIAAAALVTVAAGILHRYAGRRRAAWASLGLPWREVGAVLALAALFGAALPLAEDPPRPLPVLLWVALAAGVVLGALAAASGTGVDRYEVGLGAAALALTLVLALWRGRADIGTVEDLTPPDLARAVTAVVVYLLLASGYAVLGALRGSDRLTAVAAAALVLFTTTQAFAVFAPILPGGVLFVAVGGVLLVTGLLADRGRRRLRAARGSRDRRG